MSATSEPSRRRPISRRIVTDEEMRPVAVQVSYEDWLEIERLLDDAPVAANALESALGESSGIWTEGDGLAYQQRLRGEWGET